MKEYIDVLLDDYLGEETIINEDDPRGLGEDEYTGDE